MQNKELINSIYDDFYKITKKNISKTYIKNKILPLFYFIENSKKNMFLIAGSQGIGKTTYLKILKNNFHKYFDKKILSLSLDDYYYDLNIRKKLSKNVHPLLITRGVPGTHDVKELRRTINLFKKSIYPIKTPIFNKLNDKKSYKKRIFNETAEILILEGWCCGSPHIKKDYLYKNINSLEKKFDKKYVWRNYYNNKLKNEYNKIFKEFDNLIYFKASSFKNVKKWRLLQENKLKKQNNSKKGGMNKKEVEVFIKHYEKITKWMIKKLPEKANLTFLIDKNFKIKKISSV